MTVATFRASISGRATCSQPNLQAVPRPDGVVFSSESSRGSRQLAQALRHVGIDAKLVQDHDVMYRRPGSKRRLLRRVFHEGWSVEVLDDPEDIAYELVRCAVAHAKTSPRDAGRLTLTRRAWLRSLKHLKAVWRDEHSRESFEAACRLGFSRSQLKMFFRLMLQRLSALRQL